MPTPTHDTFHRFFWDYPVDVPRLDVQRDARTQIPGNFSRLVGVDGRYTGKLRRFAGTIGGSFDLTPLTDPDGDGTITIGASQSNLIKPFAIQQSVDGSNIVRGILFMGVSSTGSKDKLYVRYSVDSGALTTATVKNFGATTGRPSEISVAVDQQLLYVTGLDQDSPAGKIEFVARYAGTTGGWVASNWNTKIVNSGGQGVTKSVATTTLGTAAEPGKLIPEERYGYVARIVYPDQGFVGPLFSPREINVDRDTVETAKVWQVVANTMGVQTNRVFSRAIVQMFRTVWRNYDVASARGQLFLESELEIPRHTGNKKGSFKTNRDYNDTTRVITHVEGDDPNANGTFLLDADDVGATIYLLYPIRTKDAGTADGDYLNVVLRRKVTAVDVGAKTVTFDQDAPAQVSTDFALNAMYWVTHVDDSADSTGTFVTINMVFPLGWAANTSSSSVPEGIRPDLPLGLTDEALAQQPHLEAIEFSTFNSTGNPPAKAVAAYEGFFVYVTTQGEGGGGRDVLRWGFIDRPRKGLIPVLHRRALHDLSDQFLGLVEAGTFLVGVLTNSFLRIHRSGDRLAIDTIHNKFGAVSTEGIVVIGTNMYVPSPVGILVVDLTAGQVDVLNATQHFFDEGGDNTGNWRDDLASVEGAYDVETGALVFLNPVKFEVLILWMNHGTFTHLIDVSADRLLSTANLQTGGTRRASLWNTQSGIAHVLKTTHGPVGAAFVSHTLAGDSSSAKHNGTITAVDILSSTSVDITDSSAGSLPNGNPAIGLFVRVRSVPTDPADATIWKRGRITAATTTKLTLDVFSSTNFAHVGDRYVVAAVPMQVTWWPLSGNPEAPQMDSFVVKKVTSMGAVLGDIERDHLEAAGVVPAWTPSATVPDDIEYQVFERVHRLATATTPATYAKNAEKSGISTSDNASNVATIKQNGAVLIPGIEIWTSDRPLDLLGLIVRGKISGSFADKALTT